MEQTQNKGRLTRREAFQNAADRLASAGIDDARRNAEWMLCDAVGCRRAELYAHFEEILSEKEAACFGRMVERRAVGEPLQYVLEHTDFYGLSLTVSPAVLIPRPETEQVVEAGLNAIELRKEPRVLDVGTGSGCIALAICHERPAAGVWASDISEAALEVAGANAEANGLDVTFFQADALDASFTDRAPDQLDLIISNPPYVSEEETASLPAEVRDHEPHLAIFARGEPLVFYRALARHGRILLRDGGFLVVETHEEFGSAAETVLREAGYAGVELRRDYADRPRILIGRQSA